MARIPSRVEERIKAASKKYSKVLEAQKSRDINENDTVTIIIDMLTDIFGYDRYADITKEYAVRSTFCDLAVKQNDKVEYLIECKAIGVELKENHLRQALEYSTASGIDWAILTNGQIWKAYKVIYDKPIRAEEILCIDFINNSPRDTDFIEKVFVLSKEALSKRVIDEFHEQTQLLNKFILSALLLSDDTIDFLRRRLRDVSRQVRVENDMIKTVVVNDMLKREIIESPDLEAASKKIGRVFKKLAASKQKSNASVEEHKDTEVLDKTGDLSINVDNKEQG